VQTTEEHVGVIANYIAALFKYFSNLFVSDNLTCKLLTANRKLLIHCNKE